MLYSRSRHVSVAAIALACFTAAAQIPNPGSEGKIQLEWLKDYSAALKRAEAEKKPLLIDITTDWCGWSKKMERETFADASVQKELRSCVLIRLNPEASEKNQKIVELYGGDGYPTLVVANYRGEELASSSGYLSAKDFLDYLRRYLPLFKGNPLGYKSIQLDASDPLLKVIRKIPPPESRPTSVGSMVVLDQSTVRVETNGAAKMIVRSASYVLDREKPDQPNATRFYVSSRQKFKFRSIRILDTKGAGREVDLKSAKDEHAYSNQNVYWDTRIVSVDLPVLKEGQILDVIEERDCQPIMPGEFYHRWNTGAASVLLTSDLSITFPASLKLQKRPFRCPTEVLEQKNPDGTITWELITSYPKPFEPVVFGPPLYAIWQGYEFYSGCSKDSVARWFGGLCQGRDVLPATARQRVAALKQSHGSQTALLQALLDWVTKDIRYVSVAFGASSHQPHPVSDTLANLYGDCKDQALLLQALCREAGIPAAIVLVDASGEGCDETCPAIERFDHCIVEAQADHKAYYLDPAWGPARLGRIALPYAGTRALKLEGPTGRVIVLPDYEPLMDQESAVTGVKLNPNGSATITENTCLAGVAALKMKERMKVTTPDKIRKYIESSNKNTGRKLLDFFMTDANAPGDKYESRLVYTVPRFASMTAGGLAFKLGAQGREADWIGALSMSRTQPFWFQANDVAKTTFIVELPPGARLKGRPNDLQVDTLFMKASRTVTLQQNKLTVTETSRILDARLEASQSGTVYDTFRKLHDHRDYSFVVEVPLASPAESGLPAPVAAAGTPVTRLLHLNGISGGAGHKLVMVNGKTIAAGESASLQLNGRNLSVRCVSIGDQSACFKVDGINGTTELELKQ